MNRTAPARQDTTCDLSQKIARFDAWLAQFGVSFSEDDIPRRKKAGG